MGNSAYLRELVATRTLLDTDLFPHIYLSLHTGDPGDTGQREIEGGGYKRSEIEFMHVNGGTMNNRNDLPFSRLPKSVVSYFGLWDAESEGRFLTGGPWNTPEDVPAGQDRTIRSAELVIRMG